MTANRRYRWFGMAWPTEIRNCRKDSGGLRRKNAGNCEQTGPRHRHNTHEGFLRMFRGLTGVSLLLFGSCCAFGQTAAPLAFEVASVKPDLSGSGSSSSNGSKGQTVFTNVSLRRLIERAYNVKPFQVTGPDWLDNVRFDITAKYPGDTNNEQRALMLRTLLVERFHLATHRESKDMPAYALLVAKSGPKLEVTKMSGDSTSSNRGRFEDKAVSMAGLADQLARQLERPVVDKTGLTAVYTLKLEWTPDDQPAGRGEGGAGEPALGPSIFTAVQEQLGLRLQTQKLPVEIIVVDRVDRAPTEN
jgi:uncharacterized protein (TIGR03435 family)